MTQHPEPENNVEKYDKWFKKDAELLEQIEQYEFRRGSLKMELKEEPKHITWKKLDEKDKFFGLQPEVALRIGEKYLKKIQPRHWKRARFSV
jgi:hypothetical protein